MIHLPMTIQIFLDNRLGHENDIIKENSLYRSLGLSTLCYFNAYVSTSYTSLFDEGISNGYFIKNASNLAYLFPYFGDIISRHFFIASVDFSNDNASRWYQKQIQQSIDLGYNGFMLDFGEYTPIDSISSNGKIGHEMHNHFIELYQKAVYDMTRNTTAIVTLLSLDENEKKDLNLNYQSDFVFHTRSGFTQSMEYTQLHWTGDASSDWNPHSGLPAHVQACLGVGISGVPYCSSPIGGYVCEFYSPLSTELLIRWLQVGVFSGFMHDETEGSACTPERVQLFTNNQSEYAWRKYAKLRTQLFPYIFTAAHEAHATGLPITRHHFLSFYNDEIAIKQEYQYTFGNDVLVAPVVRSNQTLQDVYLPSGEDWIDLSTNLIYDDTTDGRFRIGRSNVINGGQWMNNVRADLLTVPVFVRAGAILPLIDPSVFTLNPGKLVSLADRSYILHVWIFPDVDQRAAGLVWDGLMINLEKCNSNQSLCIELTNSSYRLVIVQIPSIVIPSSISSKTLTPFERTDRWQNVVKIEPLEQLKNSFTYDVEQQVIWIAMIPKTNQTNFDCQINF